MKHLQLHNKSYQEVLKDYTQWLHLLGFAAVTVYNLPHHLKEFFYYLETKNIHTINHITMQTITDYYNYLKNRGNQRSNTALSSAYLNKHQQALFKFREYLKAHHHKGISIHLKREKQSQSEHLQVLTQSEVKALFTATNHSSLEERIQYRDKAILVLLYSCGLRRNEAISLHIKDILFEKQRIYVRKGKNYKERYVPINAYNLKILETYIYEYRYRFCNIHNNEHLLLNYRGTALQGRSIANRLQVLVSVSKLKNKNITPHILRHSIATHLLERGAAIEDISTFLGHNSLESTQIYTHILEERANQTKDEKLHRLLREKRLQQQKYSNLPNQRNTFYNMDA